MVDQKLPSQEPRRDVLEWCGRHPNSPTKKKSDSLLHYAPLNPHGDMNFGNVLFRRTEGRACDLTSLWLEAQEKLAVCDWKSSDIGIRAGSYDSACRIAGWADLSLPLVLNRASRLELEFGQLASQWYRETGMISMIHKKAMHPAYQRIIGMGKDALPFIFRELNKKRGDWLWALCAITGDDAAKPAHNFKEAVEAWLRWGEEHGYF